MIGPELGCAQGTERSREAETQRSREPEAEAGERGFGSAQGKEWAMNGLDGGDRRNRMPRAHTGSVNHVCL
jgi:hypothetical protein